MLVLLVFDRRLVSTHQDPTPKCAPKDRKVALCFRQAVEPTILRVEVYPQWGEDPLFFHGWSVNRIHNTPVGSIVAAL